MVGLGVSGVGGDGFLEVVRGQAVIAIGREEVRKIVVGLGVVGLACDGGAEVRGGGGAVVLLRGDHAHEVVSIGLVGVDDESFGERLFGLSGAAHPQPGVAEIGERGGVGGVR